MTISHRCSQRARARCVGVASLRAAAAKCWARGTHRGGRRVTVVIQINNMIINNNIRYTVFRALTTVNLLWPALRVLNVSSATKVPPERPHHFTSVSETTGLSTPHELWVL